MNKIIASAALALALGLTGCGISTGTNATGGASGLAAAAKSQGPPESQDSSAPARTVDHIKTRVLFTVSGSAPDGADITYGSDSDNRSPAGGLGELGNGTAVPWSGSVKYHDGDLFYSVSAQLQGSGNITCKVRVKVTIYWTDGTHRAKSKTVAHGHASNGYNVCRAESNN
jgi:hypothetical protein